MTKRIGELAFQTLPSKREDSRCPTGSEGVSVTVPPAQAISSPCSSAAPSQKVATDGILLLNSQQSSRTGSKPLAPGHKQPGSRIQTTAGTVKEPAGDVGTAIATPNEYLRPNLILRDAPGIACSGAGAQHGTPAAPLASPGSSLPSGASSARSPPAKPLGCSGPLCPWKAPEDAGQEGFAQVVSVNGSRMVPPAATLDMLHSR
ncbi:hypothetical protein UY3_16871 [Chelonia mydas]|uniref:Uncharacterized protein n=1 Tax=Chelonia mydas TaxID=8469 RepID=M7ALH7_CHEMY|nr:hypothetical protein UY3_16871 [Chelonia mydas]